MHPRTVLITGAGSGIGRATALLLSKAKDTFKVVATDVNADTLGSLVVEAPDIRAEIMDVSKNGDPETVIPRVARSENGLHALVNNAGTLVMGAVEMTPDEWHRRVFEVNYWGTVRCCRAALPLMRGSASQIAPVRPRVINVSSIAGLISLPFIDAYTASKHAVEGLSEAMALTLPATGIDVSLVQPAATATGIAESAELTVREMLEGATGEPNQQLADMLRVMWPSFKACLTAEQGAQSPEEVAEVVKTVLTAEQPHLRNLTQHQAKTLLGVKLHDVVGDKTIAAVHDFVQTNWHISRDFKPLELHE